MDKKNFISLTLAGVVLLLSFTLRSILIDGVGETKLQTSSPYGGTVAMELSPQNNGKLPVEGQDFTLIDTQLFENGLWVASEISSEDGGGYVVLKNVDGFYVAAIGPGTIFSSSYRKTLPPEVFSYLESKGAIGE